MRIAFPSDDQVNLTAHTGRCLGFMIYDVTSDGVVRVDYRANDFTGLHHRHGAGRSGDAGNDPAGQIPAQGRRQAFQHGHGHGHGHGHTALAEALGDCQAMVALGMGPRLEQDLVRRGMEVYFTRTRDIARLLEQWRSGEFETHPDGSACREPHHHAP